jgi:hypothetical protein
MTAPYRTRKMLAAAYDWQRDKEVRLVQRIRLMSALMHSLRQELAEFRQLEGEELARRFCSESLEEIEQTMGYNEQRFQEVAALWTKVRQENRPADLEPPAPITEERIPRLQCTGADGLGLPHPDVEYRKPSLLTKSKAA